jgi:Ca2+-binding RTX toxin-like protein
MSNGQRLPRRPQACADSSDEVDEHVSRTYRCFVSLRAFSVVAFVCVFSLAASTLALSQLAWTFGTNGPDNLTGTAGDDAICGLDGDDVITGGAGVDMLIGDGRQIPETGQCHLVPGKDALGVGNDTLYSGPGAGGFSHLFGGAGNDVLVGGPDFDVLSGGQGDDEIRDSSGSSGLRNMLDGGAGDDELIGSRDGEILSGGTGRNVLKGRAGNDDLYAPGKSTYDAGPGDDYVGSRNRKRDRIDCGRGRDKVYADKGDLLRNCEKRVTAGAMGAFLARPSFGKSPSSGAGGGPR